jgi:hypothetical protein
MPQAGMASRLWRFQLVGVNGWFDGVFGPPRKGLWPDERPTEVSRVERGKAAGEWQLITGWLRFGRAAP